MACSKLLQERAHLIPENLPGSIQSPGSSLLGFIAAWRIKKQKSKTCNFVSITENIYFLQKSTTATAAPKQIRYGVERQPFVLKRENATSSRGKLRVGIKNQFL